MNKKFFRIYFILFGLLVGSLLLVACNNLGENKDGRSINLVNDGPVSEGLEGSSNEAPTPITISPGLGGITGVISNQSGSIPDYTRVYLAEFIPSEEGWGVYILDTGTAISTLVDESGFFQIPDIVPGEYVLVVGAQPERSAIIQDAEGEARVFTISPDEILDIGQHELELQSIPVVPENLPYPGPISTLTPYP